MKKKSKYNRGTQHKDFWVFGGVERSTGKWFCKLVNGDRTKPTLSQQIKAHIAPETTIMSDKFASYVSSNEKHTLENNRMLKKMKYSHKWVNHSENFVDPDTGAHTQTIEGVWEVKLKMHVKKMRGMRKDMIGSYLDEYMWRSWFFPKKARLDQYFNGLIFGIRKHSWDTKGESVDEL
jgi:transposase-like protein